MPPAAQPGDDRPYPVHVLRRPRRRTVGLQVTAAGEVRVLLPRGVPESAAAEMLDRHATWIARRLEDMRRQRQLCPPPTYAEGMRLLHLGRQYSLVYADTDVVRRRDDRVELPRDLAGRPGDACRALAHWYARQAFGVLRERVAHWAPVVDVETPPICVKYMRSRWGSCGTRGRLNLNWRLVMAPLDIVDYVVVHELCHLYERNHGADYWTYVEAVMPDHAERRAWLRQHGELLDLRPPADG